MKRYVPRPLSQRATNVATAISPKDIHDQMTRSSGSKFEFTSVITTSCWFALPAD
jgi:hypothetical protein